MFGRRLSVLSSSKSGRKRHAMIFFFNENHFSPCRRQLMYCKGGGAYVVCSLLCIFILLIKYCLGKKKTNYFPSCRTFPRKDNAFLTCNNNGSSSMIPYFFTISGMWEAQIYGSIPSAQGTIFRLAINPHWRGFDT